MTTKIFKIMKISLSILICFFSLSFADSDLPPEYTVFDIGKRDHTQPQPTIEYDESMLPENVTNDPDYKITIEDCATYSKCNEINEDMNHSVPKNQTRFIRIAGRRVVFEAGKQPFSLFHYDNGKGPNDIRLMEIIAEEVLIKNSLHLPQTEVAIFAKKLEIEGINAQIITTP